MNKTMLKFYREIEKMSLNESDKALCREIAREIIKEAIKEHIKSCPHGVAMQYSKKMVAAVIIGCMLGSGVVGGAGMALAKFISSL